MSFPNVPDVEPSITLAGEDSIALLLASVALEELSLAHILNAEAEKIQYALGTLDGRTSPEPPASVADLLTLNRSVNGTLRNVIKKEMLLLDPVEAVTASTTTTSTTTTTTTTTGEPVSVGSAWSQGTHFGTSAIAQYTTLAETEDDKTVNLVMGATEIVVGTVQIHRSGSSLSVTVATNAPYLMGKAHLYVDDTPPVDSNPGGFPYQYDPAAFFTSHTFVVDITGLTGTLYIAAHADIYQSV